MGTNPITVGQVVEPWQETRRRVKERLYHACTKEELRDIKSNIPGLLKLLRKLTDRGEIVRTELPGKNGRPAYLYSIHPVTYPWHELYLTRALLSLGGDWRRGQDVNQKLLPDAESEEERIEMDCSTERGRKIDERIRVYEGTGTPVVWIVVSKERRQSLLDKTGKAGGTHWIGLYEEIIKQGRRAELLRNVGGQIRQGFLTG